jgi:transketolase
VSMPCWELFEAQDQDYQDQVLPPQVTARLAVEAGSTALWHQWVGLGGGVVGIDRFGASAPGGTALIKFGFTEDNVVERALAVLHRESVEKARMLRNLSA